MTTSDNRTSSGKWSRSGVPHKGWTCVDTEDLDTPSQTCEMCETQVIRYVHYMQHPNYSSTLAVGCVCAEHMEDDYVRPREREKKMRAMAGRRRRWASRTWRTSKRGNLYIKHDGFLLVIFPLGDERGSRWKLSITHVASQTRTLGRRIYKTQEAAKRASFDALTWAKQSIQND